MSNDFAPVPTTSSNDLLSVGADSPFDRGRVPCPQGGEDLWSARWLMQQMGYDDWKNFEKVIERAKSSAANQGFNPRILFRHEVRPAGGGVVSDSGKNLGGRPMGDYLVTRFAAYLIAMNGDPRKPEVAAAQEYFAVKTREAETAPSFDLTNVDDIAALTEGAARAIQMYRAEAEKARALEVAIERDAPLVAKAEAHSGSDSAIHRQAFSREVQNWGRKQGMEIRQEEVLAFLGHIGMFIRGERTDTGHATAEAQRRGLAFTDKGTAQNGHAWATGKLTAAGQDYAWKRIAKHAAENRNLRLPRELRSGDQA
jgi:hypothetical protein